MAGDSDCRFAPQSRRLLGELDQGDNAASFLVHLVPFVRIEYTLALFKQRQLKASRDRSLGLRADLSTSLAEGYTHAQDMLKPQPYPTT
jgi:hypothetical protein